MKMPPKNKDYYSYYNSNNDTKVRYLNDKENMYKMEIPEIIIITLIIILWFLSIRKFTKQFERIRTTHYREMPYSYQSKKLNEHKITIVKRETDSVIYSAPAKLTRSKSFPSDQLHSINIPNNIINKPNINTSSNKNPNESNENINQIKYSSNKNLSVIEIKNNKLICSNSYTYNDNGYLNINKSLKNSPNFHHKKNNSGSFSPLLVEFECSPKKFIKCIDENENQNSQNYLSANNSNLINPLLIPPIVRRSLLDLHRRSVEHVTNTNQMIGKKYFSKDHINYTSEDREDINEKTDFVESPV